MKTSMFSIVLMIICTLFTSTAQILYKIGAGRLTLDIFSIITNWHLIIGIILYTIGAILMIIALKGGEVTILFPIITLSYIWVNIGSKYFFNEELNMFKWLGIGALVIGIMLINPGGEK